MPGGWKDVLGWVCGAGGPVTAQDVATAMAITRGASRTVLERCRLSGTIRRLPAKRGRYVLYEATAGGGKVVAGFSQRRRAGTAPRTSGTPGGSRKR